MKIFLKRPILLLSIVFFGISIIVRFFIYELSNEDVVILQDWYMHFYKKGAAGLANGNFSNYQPLYLYLLWISRLFSEWIDSITAIKIIPTLFDFLSAFAIFLMARMRYEDDMPYLFSSLFFSLPTIVFNSTGWGQIESMYTSFLLLSTYFLLKEKPFWALLMFGVSFSIKSQSIFFLPFLGIVFLKNLIRWYHFMLLPTVYLIAAFPAMWVGRSFESVLTIYIGQVGQFRSLSMSAPNLYIFIPDVFYDVGVWVGMVFFFFVMFVFGWANWRSKAILNEQTIMLLALTSLVLVPFVLPKMHDRYFYPADVFSFAAVIFLPEMWFIPLVYQLISALSYTVFILNASNIFVMLAAIINTGAVIYIVNKQYRSLYA